nr:MAG: hypothetical protein 1 [Leviviridae sp.]
MGTPRTRSQELNLHSPGYYQSGYYPGGNWTPVGGPVSGSSLSNIQEYMNDTLGPGPPFTEPHSLYLRKIKVDPLLYNGEARLSGFNWRRHFSYAWPNWTGFVYVPSPPATDWNYWHAKAMAAINPFKPQVDIPLFLFELKDFPRMLRGLGSVLSGTAKAKDTPGGYLAYQFGWAPLLGDLAKLADFGKLMQNAQNSLTNAANGARVSRKIGNKSSPGSAGTQSYALGSDGNYVLGWAEESSVEAWTTARVHLVEPLPLPVYDRQMLILRTALGLNASAATIWEAIPWSWLIDYFTNIGALMEARRGYTRWYFKDMHVMVTSTYRKSIMTTLNQVRTMSYSGGEMSHIRKERSYVGANPNVGLGLAPMLSLRQVSILGALATASSLRNAR